MVSKVSKVSKVNIRDEFEINGRVYFIPDKLIETTQSHYLGIEYIKLYKFLLASVIDIHLDKKLLKDITKISKTLINNYVVICDRIFSHIITGKINIIHLSSIENEIINKIPDSLIPKLNPNIVERLE
jgi:hypothetical protein